MIDQQYKQDNERLQEIIAALMDEAALKTKFEVESLRKIYNTNLEKLIDEVSFLESDRNNKTNQLDKCLRAKKALEQEIENVNIVLFAFIFKKFVLNVINNMSRFQMNI